MGLSLSETWNGALVKTSLVALFERCGWPSHMVSECGSDRKQGIVDTLLAAPSGASWISDVTHCVANALKHYDATLSLFQQFQTLCTRIRQRLQQTRLAFLLPPKARAKGRFLGVSRQAEWGLRTIASWDEKEREPSPEAETLAYVLRGLKPFKPFLTIFVRNTTCVNEVMRMVKTHGLSAESMQACQERLEDLPARSPIRKEVSHYVQQYLPIVESNDSPMLGSSDVIASLIGKAKQRLEANGRSELHTSILLIPCMCGDLTQDLVAEALTTVRVQDVATSEDTPGATPRLWRGHLRPQSSPPALARRWGQGTQAERGTAACQRPAADPTDHRAGAGPPEHAGAQRLRGREALEGWGAGHPLGRAIQRGTGGAEASVRHRMVPRRPGRPMDVVGCLAPTPWCLVPNAWYTSCWRRSHRRSVVPWSIAEPTTASWDIAVTADSHGLCTLTALGPPAAPQPCPGRGDGEASGPG